MTLLLRVAYAGYLECVGYLVFSPGQDAPGGALQRVRDALAALGLAVGSVPLEIASNVVLFVPLSLLGVFVLGRPGVLHWAGAGLLASAFIEGVQGLFLDQRVASATDLVANTAGAVVGAVAAALLLRSRHGAARGRVVLGGQK